MDQHIIVPIAGMAMIVALALGVPFVRALARRWERDSSQASLPPDLTTRLERIEQAVDAVALEVERISEGQRFTTRLLSERVGDAGAAKRTPDG
jgi:hypothetical protein